MSGSVLILRAQPGAEATAAKARKLGLEAVVAPIFDVRPIAWQAPDPERFDAVVLTSANAARHGGAALASLTHLPCFVVGPATASAAASAGFSDVRIGPSNGAALMRLIADASVSRALHLCGRHHIPLDDAQETLVSLPVYAAEAVEALPPDVAQSIADEALVLLHSPRSALCFGKLFDRAGLQRESSSIVAISQATQAAAGSGWKAVALASEPRDEALLELAAKLCQTGARGSAGTGR